MRPRLVAPTTVAQAAQPARTYEGKRRKPRGPIVRPVVVQLLTTVPLPVPEAIARTLVAKRPLLLRLLATATVTGHGQRARPSATRPPARKAEHEVAATGQTQRLASRRQMAAKPTTATDGRTSRQRRVWQQLVGPTRAP